MLHTSLTGLNNNNPRCSRGAEKTIKLATLKGLNKGKSKNQIDAFPRGRKTEQAVRSLHT